MLKFTIGIVFLIGFLVIAWALIEASGWQWYGWAAGTVLVWAGMEAFYKISDW